MQDHVAPTVRIVFPVEEFDTAREYDETGDALLDLRVEWSDALSGVDPATARISVIEGVLGAAGPGDDILGEWTADRVDEDGLSAHETLGALLHPRISRIVVSVEDEAGNRGVDTITVALPHGALHKQIETNRPEPFAGGIALCEDDMRVYVMVESGILVVDAESLEFLGGFDTTIGFNFVAPVCLEGGRLYHAGSRVFHFDRTRLEWVRKVEGSFLSHSLIRSRSDPTRLYAGEQGSGTIGIIDTETDTRTGHFLPFSPFDEFISGLAVLDSDAKLYATRFAEGGILVVDPSDGSELTRIDVDTGDGVGRTSHITLSPDDQRLYAAISIASEPGLGEIDTSTDQLLRVATTFPFSGIAVALSPDGTRAFLTTQDEGEFSSNNWLFDVSRWQLLESFPRPHPPGEIRFDQAAVFHPSGRFVFVARDSDVDVYLVRE